MTIFNQDGTTVDKLINCYVTIRVYIPNVEDKEEAIDFARDVIVNQSISTSDYQMSISAREAIE